MIEDVLLFGSLKLRPT